ncbi:hypothetical protein F2Q69_00013070 [Brassica cretica]|uniref:Uncharacterized protein n=1 Tax=Brassica cretica TaxID=69181 RepID=A0A8S9QQ28_BRACR|nr:hypothetical protein F2Q69_00013070 [Brassica cretica]
MSFGGSHWCRSTPDFEHRLTDFNHNRSTGSPEHRSMIPTESRTSCNVKETAIDRQPPAPIDRRAPLIYRVQMPKIVVARLNALKPLPKLDNPPKTIRTPSDDAADPMKVDRDPMGRTQRKKKEKVVKHLKRGANENERETCHCGAEYETEYSASIETHTATSIDSARQISTDTPKEESVDGSPNDWENYYYNPTMAAHTKDTMHTEEYDEDFEKERAIEYKAALEEENRLLHHSSWKGMRRRSTEHAQHRSTSILFKQDENEHRPTLPTSHRSTLESTVYEKETTRLAVGQMITITKAMQ